MILVDTSVWIDFLRGSGSQHHLALHDLIEEDEDICLANIIMTEILQGIKDDKEFKRTKTHLLSFPIYSLKGTNSYVEAAQIYRTARRKGLTIRRPLDCIIARIAVENNLTLLHNDRDFHMIAEVVDNLRMLEVSGA